MAADSKLQSRRSILLFSVAAITVGAGCALLAGEDGTITLRPGQDLQAIAQDSPEGTRFLLAPGTYRGQTIFPKDRQEFIGQDDVVLSGAIEVENWLQEGSFWIADGLPPPLPVYPGCETGRERCDRCEVGRDTCELREDLFVDGRPYRRVASVDQLKRGAWYYEDGRAWLADDPTGRSIELGVTPLAIGGAAEDVVLRNLIVEKYASAGQRGAIEFYEGRGWTLSDVSTRWNHGVGLFFGSETLVEGGTFSHNGQLGVAGTGDSSTLVGVEIAYNNYAGYDARWEAGGTKFHWSDGLVVKNSCVHHNDGPGLWTDIDNINVTYDSNRVFWNTWDGIKHEISYDALIKDNEVSYNGIKDDDWLWGSQVLVQNSQNVKVYGNKITVLKDIGNGISIIHQDRGIGKYGPLDAINNRIHDNTIIFLGPRGQGGFAQDTGEDWIWTDGNNTFDRNTYIVSDQTVEHWMFNDLDLAWEDVRRLGHERNGKLVVEQRLPLEVSCDRQSGS